MMGSVPFRRDTKWLASFLSFCQVRDTVRRQPAIYKSGKRALTRNQPCWHLELGLLASRTEETDF